MLVIRVKITGGVAVEGIFLVNFGDRRHRGEACIPVFWWGLVRNITIGRTFVITFVFIITPSKQSLSRTLFARLFLPVYLRWQDGHGAIRTNLFFVFAVDNIGWL